MEQKLSYINVQKSKDFNPQEKRERERERSAKVRLCVQACRRVGGRISSHTERKKERKS
jgi:hypothetical protein